MSIWIISISYTLHLIGTVVWLGGLFVLALIVWPARQGGVDSRWIDLQKQLVPWINGSLAILLITGFYQMTSDTNYSGFFVMDSPWAWALLWKHVAFFGLSAVTLVMQYWLLPQLDQLRDIEKSRPNIVAAEIAQNNQRQRQLLWLNCILAVLILIATAVMTAL